MSTRIDKTADGAGPLWTNGFRLAVVYAGALCLLFAPFLWQLARFALQSHLYSHILLVPFISGWFVWRRRDQVRTHPAAIPRVFPVFTLALLAAAVGHAWPAVIPPDAGMPDRIVCPLLVFVTALLMGMPMALGRARTRTLLFPLLFLYFMVPMPDALSHAITVWLQHSSAWVLSGLFRLTPIPVLRDGLIFHLPGFSLFIAEACSGIRSSLVLLLTAILAGALCLRSPWRRAILAACVFPLAALRNATRILTLAAGALYVDPDILTGPLHRQGGTPFFVLSLIPLFLLILLLRRGERRRHAESPMG